MKKRIKDGVVMALVAVVVALFFQFAFGAPHSRNVIYNELDYQATLEDDGDLRVTQTIDVTLKRQSEGDYYHQIYQQYILNPKNLTGITDITVEDLDTGQTYQQTDPVTQSELDRYDPSTWTREKAGTWYLAALTDNGRVTSSTWDGELVVAQSDQSDPYAILGATVDPDGHKSNVPGSQRVELGWNIPAVSSYHGRFRIGMTMKNVATSFTDAAGFQWEPISNGSSALIKKLTGKITTPQSMRKDDGTLKAWMHYTGDGEVSLDQNVVTFNADDVDPHEYVDLVVVGKGYAVNAERRVDSPGFDKVIKVENEMESQWISKERVKAIGKIAAVVFFVVLNVVMIFFCVKTAIQAKKGMTYDGGVEYWREPPDLSPSSAAELYAGTSWSGYDTSGDPQDNVVTATVMSLVVKGYIKVFPGNVDLYDGIDLLTEGDESIARMISSQSNGRHKRHDTSTVVMLDAAWNDDGRSKLRSTEKVMLDTLKMTSDVLGSRVFDFDMLNKTIKSGGKQIKGEASVSDLINIVGQVDPDDVTGFVTSGSDVRKLIKMWSQGLKVAEASEWKSLSLTTPISAKQVACFWSLPIMSILIGIQSRSFAALCLYTLPVSVICMFVFGFIRSFTKLTPKGQEMAGQVQGLARYLLDFSDFKDRDVLDVVLWGEYLTYATAFGIAPKVVDQLRRANINYDEGRSHYGQYDRAVWYGSTSLVYWSTNSSFGMDGWDLGSSINSAIGEVSNTISVVTRSSSGSGGSGGHSFGGSSGGSGGGSFGAR